MITLRCRLLLWRRSTRNLTPGDLLIWKSHLPFLGWLYIHNRRSKYNLLPPVSTYTSSLPAVTSPFLREQVLTSKLSNLASLETKVRGTFYVLAHGMTMSIENSGYCWALNKLLLEDWLPIPHCIVSHSFELRGSLASQQLFSWIRTVQYCSSLQR